MAQHFDAAIDDIFSAAAYRLMRAADEKVAAPLKSKWA